MNDIIVCPITSGRNDFSVYIPLHEYKIYGRGNATQIHSFDIKWLVSKEFIDQLRGKDFLLVKQILDYSLEIDSWWLIKIE